MAIDGFKIIGESINDSVPSTKKLFAANDIEGLKELAKFQDEKGASWIDVNVGLRPAEFMAEMVRTVQSITAKPLSIDSPDPELAKAGLEAYDKDRAGGAIPILNSISPMRPEMFDLYAVQPFMPILLLSESEVDGKSQPNKTAEDAYGAAKQLLGMAHEKGIPSEHCIFDPGIAPIGSDTEGLLKMVVGVAELMHNDPEFKGVHMSVGLSNFTVMLPPKTKSGELVKSPLESAFITITNPLGLDMVIGSVKRKYRILEEDHPAMQCLRDCLAKSNDEALMRVMEFYSS